MCGGAKGLGSEFKGSHVLGVLIVLAEEALSAGLLSRRCAGPDVRAVAQTS